MAVLALFLCWTDKNCHKEKKMAKATKTPRKPSGMGSGSKGMPQKPMSKGKPGKMPCRGGK